MDNIRITGSDKRCLITGEDFSYRFENGHPTEIIIRGERQGDVPFPENKGKPMKPRTKLVHKYWDSVMVITLYTRGLKKTEVRYHILSDGEMKTEKGC